MNSKSKRKIILIIVTFIILSVFYFADYEYRSQVGILLEISKGIRFLSSLWNYFIFFLVAVHIIKAIDKGEF